MRRTITKEQLRELEDCIYDQSELHDLLEEYTGIKAEPYTAFSYYDENGNYIGNSEDYGIRELLESAYIEVVKEA